MLIGSGVFFMSEVLSFAEICIAISLVLVIMLLGVSKSSGNLPNQYDPLAGLSYSLISATSLACALTMLAPVSRQVHSFLVAYS